MRKSMALKTLLRSPLKTLLTFLLIAAASFALFSRVTEYAVTTRETAKAESFYSGVAALDTSRPTIAEYYQEPKPWPSDAQLEEFASLPGVTLADTRYQTEGLVEDYKRVIDPQHYWEATFVVEGTYAGFEKASSDTGYINFTDITVLAGEIELDPRFPMRVRVSDVDEIPYHSYPESFFEELETGSRCLVIGSYSELYGGGFALGSYMIRHFNPDQEVLRVIDGVEDGYLETEEFAWCKGIIEAAKQSVSAYDIVYTSDMRAIPFVNEHRLVISEGKPLTAGDTDACVVSELFLETYGLSVGDRIHIKFGDKLERHYGSGGSVFHLPEDLADFTASADLEIIGAYQFTDEAYERYIDSHEWSYGPATIFVPASFLPVEIPEDYEVGMGDFSVFVENPQDIEAFRDAAELWAADLGLALRFSDGGWLSMKDSFVTDPLVSFLTTVLYVAGAALALFLAIYLYMARNKKIYAIMRTLGVTGKKAGSSLVFPLCFLSVIAMAAGGLAGLFYASYAAEKALAGLSNSSSPEGYVYVLNAAIPTGVVILCLVLELAVTILLLLVFLQKMKKISPLELLQEGSGRSGMGMRKRRTASWRNREIGIGRTGAARESASNMELPSGDASMPCGKNKEIPSGDISMLPAGIDMAKISAVSQLPARRNYSALRQTCAYILRQMRRGIGKTAVSFVLTIVLAAGLGIFVLARLACQDACRELNIKGVATGFSSSTMMELSKNDLVKDFYYYANYDARVNNVGIISPITFSNDFDRYLSYLDEEYTITYAKGYDASVFERTGGVCLMGQALAESLGIQPGDEITLMSDYLYSFMVRLHEDEEDNFEFYSDENDFLTALERAGKPYRVAGILETADEAVSKSLFSAANYAAENLYSQPFEIGYCEFNLADNGKLKELSDLLEKQKSQYARYAPMASFHIDSESLENVKRIRNLLESLFPIVVTAAVLIGLFGPGLVIAQEAQEAAYMRILGVTRKRTRCTLVLEQVVLCCVGILLVAAALALYDPGRFGRSIETLGFCCLVYVLGYVCGAVAAAIQVTRHKALELLQIKE